ncbi:MAG: hypothetical protein ACLFQQ_22425, partial [Desulfococcaceae bacterium]
EPSIYGFGVRRINQLCYCPAKQTLPYTKPLDFSRGNFISASLRRGAIFPRQRFGGWSAETDFVWSARLGGGQFRRRFAPKAVLPEKVGDTWINSFVSRGK